MMSARAVWTFLLGLSLTACGDDSTGASGGGGSGEGGGTTSATSTSTSTSGPSSTSSTSSTAQGTGGGAVTGSGGAGGSGGTGAGGGDGGGGGAPACDDADPACAICEAYNARDLTCGVGDDQESCPLAGASIACLIRPEAVEPFTACLADCDEFEDSCADIAGEQIEPAPDQEAYHDACFAALDRCPDDVIDDYCTQGDAFHLILRNSVYLAWTPCFELPCDEINACLESDYGDEFEACVASYL